MKKFLLSIFALSTIFRATADEGMWIPMLIGKNYQDMAKAGLKLSAEDIYNINGSSLKDAIVQFGGGCTGEIISPSGLLLTNHHCGYGNIASLSSVEKNYLDNGFWAHSYQEELPAPGLSVIFLDKIVDVTNEVSKQLGKLKGKANVDKITALTKTMETRYSEGGKKVVQLKEYFNGNQYLVLIYDKFTDVRLVGTPPKSLGKYGGDTDNWMWPRHTADFSMFRVYADANNQPAAYSKNNQPYKPKKYLPVSIAGYQDKDYAMIMGYPGRTNRYEIASGVQMNIDVVNPSIVKLRERRLAIMRKHMDADKALYLRKTTNYASIANYWKYFIGQTEQLKRLKVVDKKKQEEAAFTKWTETKEGKPYRNVLEDYNKVYEDYTPYAKSATYYSEGFRAATINRITAAMVPLADELAKSHPNQDTVKKLVETLKKVRTSNMKDFETNMEKDIFAEVTKLYYTDVPKDQLPPIYSNAIFKKYGNNEDYDVVFKKYADYIFKETFILNNEAFDKFANNPTLAELEADPAVAHGLSFQRTYDQYIKNKSEAYAYGKRDISKTYLKGLMEMRQGQLMYPDANSTMRVTYGSVLSYAPQDAVYYNHFTTMEGLLDKYKPGDYEFDLPLEFLNLAKTQNYGKYADKQTGRLHTCFITNNDITGGNSGSPIINAKGELIGCAFDGNWEAMSGDISFDQKYKRTIAVDVRFILWIVEHYGRAENLIAEMDIRN